jgi:hypothetical protein
LIRIFPIKPTALPQFRMVSRSPVTFTVPAEAVDLMIEALRAQA